MRKHISAAGMTAIFAVIGILWFSIPIGVGVLNIGNLFGILFCITVFLCAVMYPLLMTRKIQTNRPTRRLRITYRILCGFLCAGLLYTAIVTGLMISAAASSPPENAVVLVLGSQVKGKEPSLDLLNRIFAAAEYLQDHPGSRCIVSGGQGDGELVTEASVMKDYLVGMGIDPSRIMEEDQSSSTEENMEFSAVLLRETGWGNTVAVVTDEYHQYRAACLARDAGLEAYAVCARTPWYIFPACYAREILAISWMFAGGY